jgi:hypothetical protein
MTYGTFSYILYISQLYGRFESTSLHSLANIFEVEITVKTPNKRGES